ncbi:heparan-alpha-glucosaminide N-acetyltransferase isoform X2 [Phoenix dactylifera]|uniref:Heparan-alpha-glucosaminide N-acetyltransferase isoform X2 n=1 Tax=Phoenix dactylifera TaxID=42345 RepID=A0A8B9AT14_PHODC|nr:heparan-alpha-glucosaminide N-acetyltransferase isoform X2 [Phoenix dactylifera]
MMILVDGAGGEWPVIGHAPWNGCNLADFVMPFFLFIVGMAIPLSLKRIPNRLLAVRRVVVRTLKLLFWGIILQGGYSHAPDKLSYGVDMKHIRWCGILQRIALAYLVVALLEILTKDAKVGDQPSTPCSIFKLCCWQWYGSSHCARARNVSQRCSEAHILHSNLILAACILVTYLLVIYETYVPDWEFTVHNTDSQDYGKVFTVACGTRGKLDPPCNAVGYIDRQVLGINHMYQHPAWKRSKACTNNSPHEGPFRKNAPAWCQAPFDPEGILSFILCSSMSSILTTIIGVHYGHVLVHMKSHLNRLKLWVPMGLALLIFGIILHFSHAIPLNKQLYSFSYVCVTAGAAAIVFSIFYFLFHVSYASSLMYMKVCCASCVMATHSLFRVDILGLRTLFLPLEWIGMNAMLVFVMAAEGIFEGFLNGWYYESPNNTLVYWIQKHIFIKVWHSQRVGILLYVIFAQILFWALVAGVLHHLGIYWKL